MEHDDPAIDGEAARLVIAHARDYAIMTLDLDGIVRSWSPGAVQVTGITQDAAIGTHFGRLFLESDRAIGDDRRELEHAWEHGRVEDSRWHVRGDGARFWANGVTMAIRGSSPPMLIKIIRDETQSRLAEEQRVLLLNELNHRINNTLATVQSLVEQTLRAADLDRQLRDDLSARLEALSQAHRALMEHNWAGADLTDLVERALAPFTTGEDARFSVEGPPLRLSVHQAVSLSLVLHELATNAVKHGSLSRRGGRVSVHWNQALDEQGGRRMSFLWAESGGPAVQPPSRRGFGSRLLERSFPQGSGGEVKVEYAEEGVRCAVSLRLSSEAEMPMLDLAAAAQSA
ncbi:MAG: PAS domain S-box protein [Phenylobacterium sp.]|uniref:sensor histidine kinase n=1 Tax=Phenylobacterium sp. TaxID=1871053 RepID=UPI001A4B53E4|nr:HWE histidine kinase domain-containing protein [Phenylobacterium sp.]MBL8771301.1 PAS domain S-box protein [Phenylobacterium sp.]